jgi:glycopeptide antibiotics resistance protein
MALKRKREKPGLLTMFAEYMLIGWFVVFIYVTQLMPFGNGMGDLFNIQPLHMFYIAFRYGSNNAGMVWQFLLNILMFVPLGFLLPIVFSRKCALWHRVLLVSFCTTLTTELIQLITKRGTDIDDVIANTAGGLCGFALFAILCALIGLIKRRKTDIPHMGRNMVISAVVLLAVAAPFVAVIITDGLSEYGNLYYGHNQPRYIEIEGNISKEATTRAVYKYAPHTDLAVLQKKLVEASGFNGQFVQDSYGGWKLSVGENGFISISRNLTWSINYPSRIDYTPTSVIVLNEDEALIRAWFYLDQFGVTPESVRYEAAQSRFDSDGYNLVFSNIVSRENQIIVGGVSIFLTVDGELMYISDGRIWGEYVRDVNCISPFESIGIAQDIGNIVWNGTAHISSVESDYVLIDKTGYIIPAWKINAYFISESDNKYDWFPLIDAVK